MKRILGKVAAAALVVSGLVIGAYAVVSGDSNVFLFIVFPVCSLGPLGLLAALLAGAGGLLAIREWAAGFRGGTRWKGVVFLGPVPIPLGEQKLTPGLVAAGLAILALMVAATLFAWWLL